MQASQKKRFQYVHSMSNCPSSLWEKKIVPLGGDKTKVAPAVTENTPCKSRVTQWLNKTLETDKRIMVKETKEQNKIYERGKQKTWL